MVSLSHIETSPLDVETGQEVPGFSEIFSIYQNAQLRWPLAESGRAARTFQQGVGGARRPGWDRVGHPLFRKSKEGI